MSFRSLAGWLLPWLLIVSASAVEVPDMAARSYILVDFHSGRQLALKSPNTRLPPASLTKLMTAYVVFRELQTGHIRLDEQVSISPKARAAEGSRMFLEVNSLVLVEDLIKGMVIQSGNDASVALAEHVAGSEEAFAEMMNRYASKLAMNDSHFTNSHGLPHPDHYSTASDLAHLASATIREFPKFYRWYAVREFLYNKIKQYNRNRLLWKNPYVDGMKTGHTKAAGYCLVASAKKENMRLISVVLGTKSSEAREKQTQILFAHGFRYFETHKLYGKNQALTRRRIWQGASEEISLGLTQDLYVTIERKQYSKLQAEMHIDAQIKAPSQKGTRYGTVAIQLAGKPVLEAPLVALEDVPEGGLWQRFSDKALLWLE